MKIGAKDVCRCPRSHPDRTYFRFRSCRGCDLLIVSSERRKELDRLLVTRPIVIVEPKYWIRHVTKAEGAE